MFYYMKGCKGSIKLINFSIFDKYLRSIEFSSDFIESNGHKHPDEYALFEKFYKKAFAEEKVIEG